MCVESIRRDRIRPVCVFTQPSPVFLQVQSISTEPTASEETQPTGEGDGEEHVHRYDWCLCYSDHREHGVSLLKGRHEAQEVERFGW